MTLSTSQASRADESRQEVIGEGGEAVLNALAVNWLGEFPRVLVAVRRPSTNSRHPGVVSLPTMRIPAALGAGLGVGDLLPKQDRFAFCKVSGETQEIGAPGAGHHLTSFLTEALFSRKLDAASLIETRQLTGSCAVRMLAEGEVDDPTGTGKSERTRMYSVVVHVTKGAELLPEESASYSQIRWVDTESFMRSWQCRDAQLLFPDANPFEICIHGLCIRSGVELLRNAADVLGDASCSFHTSKEPL